MERRDEMRYLKLIHEGIGKKDPQAKSKKVIIVGAGMAGLVAADELLRAGYDRLILEAKSRVGGRGYTIREPFAPGLYGEAGAMRIPRSHKLTLALIEKFGLQVYPFTLSNPNAYCYLHGKKLRMAKILANPGLLDFDLFPHEHTVDPNQLWGDALAPFAARLETEGYDA